MELLYQPDSMLSKSVAPFDFTKMNAVDVAKEMADIMVEKQGIGISANQVGLDAQVFVMETTEGEIFGVFNPRIVEVSDYAELAPEGCLSSPGLWMNVKRPGEVLVEFQDQTEKVQHIRFIGRDARCFLHEFDHLQGIDFTDRVSALKVKMAKKRLQKQIAKYVRSANGVR